MMHILSYLEILLNSIMHILEIIWSSNCLIDSKVDRIRFAKKFYNFSIACSMRWITKGNKALWERYFRMTKHIFHKVFMFPVYAFSFKQSGLSKYHITLYIAIVGHKESIPRITAWDTASTSHEWQEDMV